MKNNTKQTLKIYLRQSKKYWLIGTTALIFDFVGGVMPIIIPLYYKRFFDVLTNTQNPSLAYETLISILITIGTLQGIQWVVRRITGFSIVAFEVKVMSDITNMCFANLHKHSFSFFNNNFVGSLVKKVNYYYRSFEGIADRIFWDLIPLITSITAILVVLTLRDIRLGLVLFAWCLTFIIINWIFTTYKMKYDMARNDAESTLTGALADTITNHANIKLFTGYSRERKSFGSLVDKVLHWRSISWNLDMVFNGVQGLFAIGLEIGIYILAIHLWEKGVLTLGDFVLIQAYLLTILDRLWDFGKTIRNLYENLADAEDMTVILNTPHEITDLPKAKKLKIKEASVVFKNVEFNYNETRTILSNFDLNVKSHEKIALVGPSGAGKSTIVKILLRQHDVTDGHILIDGQDIAKVTQESLWDTVSLVPQEPLLFHRTLMENIRYGKPDASDDEVVEAAKLAYCHEFISNFPEGYGTFVGERGVKLSGGERQRVAIARAILRNAPILVLDEATSSLDSESEGLIQSALTNLMKGKTVIVIAHRLSTIMKMDRIIVVNGGKISEQGSHDELLKNEHGLYKKLWDLQAGGFVGE